jgi:hypothetical protein
MVFQEAKRTFRVFLPGVERFPIVGRMYGLSNGNKTHFFMVQVSKQ